MTNRCELCGRTRTLTFHHLIPRSVHSKKRYINKFGKSEMRDRGILLCHHCHNGLHDLFDEKTLADKLNTRELLLENSKVKKHIEWVRKQK